MALLSGIFKQYKKSKLTFNLTWFFVHMHHQYVHLNTKYVHTRHKYMYVSMWSPSKSGVQSHTGWWLNHPFEKIWSSKSGSSPNRGEYKNIFETTTEHNTKPVPWILCGLHLSNPTNPSAPNTSKYHIRRVLGTQHPLQNHLQKGLEHKGKINSTQNAAVFFQKTTFFWEYLGWSLEISEIRTFEIAFFLVWCWLCQFNPILPPEWNQ